jgi:hypothetical protein
VIREETQGKGQNFRGTKNQKYVSSFFEQGNFKIRNVLFPLREKANQVK